MVRKRSYGCPGLGLLAFLWVPLLLPVLLPLLGGCDAGADGAETVLIRGSDSEVNLVQQLAEAFMAEHPEVHIAVTGGGSGTGIAALIDGTADLANSSRALSAMERLFAFRRGRTPTATLFCTDALSIIVHPDNPLSDITLADLGRIFRGEAKAWTDFGGTGPVVAYGRQSNSGTYDFFREVANGDRDFGPEVRQMNGNAQLVEAVANDPRAIGYVAVGYLRAGTDRGVKVLPVRARAGAPAISPLDTRGVKSGQYALVRPLYQYSDGEPGGALRAFLRFELSDRGSELAEEFGFYPLLAQWRDQNAHLEAP